MTLAAVLPPSEGGWSPVKKSTGVVMMFCENHALTPQECVQKYDGYTWTDRINVLIYAPGWNNDEEKMEKIGQSEGKIVIAQTGSSGPDTSLGETGFALSLNGKVVCLISTKYTQGGYVTTPSTQPSTTQTTQPAAV